MRYIILVIICFIIAYLIGCAKKIPEHVVVIPPEYLLQECEVKDGNYREALEECNTKIINIREYLKRIDENIKIKTYN